MHCTARVVQVVDIFQSDMGEKLLWLSICKKLGSKCVVIVVCMSHVEVFIFTVKIFYLYINGALCVCPEAEIINLAKRWLFSPKRLPLTEGAS